jgi:hypothetical protein
MSCPHLSTCLSCMSRPHLSTLNRIQIKSITSLEAFSCATSVSMIMSTTTAAPMLLQSLLRSHVHSSTFCQSASKRLLSTQSTMRMTLMGNLTCSPARPRRRGSAQTQPADRTALRTHHLTSRDSGLQQPALPTRRLLCCSPLLSVQQLQIFALEYRHSPSGRGGTARTRLVTPCECWCQQAFAIHKLIALCSPRFVRCVTLVSTVGLVCPLPCGHRQHSSARIYSCTFTARGTSQRPTCPHVSFHQQQLLPFSSLFSTPCTSQQPTCRRSINSRSHSRTISPTPGTSQRPPCLRRRPTARTWSYTRSSH